MKKLIPLRLLQNIDVQLLIFLIFFLNVKFVVKVLAILFMIIGSMNFKLGISLKNSRLPAFYLAIILLEFIKYLFVIRDYNLGYLLVFSMGILQWGICLLAIHYLKLRIDQNTQGKTQDTIKVFFILNFIVSVFFLAILIFHPVWLTFWGHGADISFNHPSAGDTIIGISFDTSTINASINCLALIYFLYKKEYLYCLMSIFIIALCTSNTTFFLMLSILITMVFTLREKKLRVYTLMFSLAFLLFYFVISPKNRTYIRNYFIQMYVVNKNPQQRQISDTQDILVRQGDSMVLVKKIVEIMPDSAYNYSNKKLGKAVGNFVSFRNLKLNDSGYVVISNEVYETKPGKLISFVQSYYYLRGSIRKFFLGSGIGNFSSKLAFRASGVNALGTYPKKFRYASSDFINNHLKSYLYYRNAEASKHSVLNYPFSVYNQVAGEYGFIGILMFTFFYLGYFVSKYRRLSYGRYMIMILLGFFIMEYWFESLSLIIVFELFLLLNIKEGRNNEKVSSEKKPVGMALMNH